LKDCGIKSVVNRYTFDLEAFTEINKENGTKQEATYFEQPLCYVDN
jgi:hypothetical protein